MTYPQAVQYLLSLLGDIRAAHFGLERMERLLAALDNPHLRYKVVHVAGTNGKGSTAALIEAGLRAGGLSTGLYTSPHLVRFNERLRINGEEVSDAGFAAAVEEVRAANERIVARHGRSAHPTFFESVSAAAFCGFRNAGVEWSVVEVGLGGRLDATNVVSPAVVVVTPIDFDHESFLGKGKASIAAEKAGVFKSGIPAVIAPQRPEAWAVLEERAKQLDVPVTRIGKDWSAENVTHERGYYCFEARRRLEAGERGQSIGIVLSLAGEHQVLNALTAVATLEAVGVPAAAIPAGLRDARWPGRLERIPGRPEVLLDSAHNPAGARSLARFLTRHEGGRRIHLIYGAARDKAVDEVAGILFPCSRRVILTKAQVKRSVRPGTLLALVDHHHPAVAAAATLDDALRTARAGASPEDLIVITGSIFLVGEAKEMLESVSPEHVLP